MFLLLNFGVYLFLRVLNSFVFILFMFIFLFLKFIYVRIRYFVFFFIFKVFFNVVILFVIDCSGFFRSLLILFLFDVLYIKEIKVGKLIYVGICLSK